VLYEKPHFEGRIIALEEGNVNLENVWAEPGPETEAQSSPPMLIGSIRLAVRVSALINYHYLTLPIYFVSTSHRI